MPPDCLFCKIVEGHIPAQVLYRDERCLAFADIRPQAPTHVLFVPLEHIATLNDLGEQHRELVGHLLWAAAKYAKAQGLAESGFRTVFNTNRDAGQTVFHIHLHLLGGRPLTWPPG